MKSLVVALFGSWFLLLGGTVWADDQPFFGTPRASAVLQNPGGVVSSTESAVATLQPSLEECFDLHHSQWFTASTVALYTFSSKQIPIASVRAGYGELSKFVGEVKLDAEGVTRRYLIPVIPEPVKSVLTSGILNDGWKLLGRYGHVAAFVGYDVEHHDNSDKMGGVLYGVSLGGSF